MLARCATFRTLLVCTIVATAASGVSLAGAHAADAATCRVYSHSTDQTTGRTLTKYTCTDGTIYGDVIGNPGDQVCLEVAGELSHCNSIPTGYTPPKTYARTTSLSYPYYWAVGVCVGIPGQPMRSGCVY